MGSKIILERIITENYTLEQSIDSDVLNTNVSDYRTKNAGKTAAEAKTKLGYDIGRIDEALTTTKPKQGVLVQITEEEVESV